MHHECASSISSSPKPPEAVPLGYRFYVVRHDMPHCWLVAAETTGYSSLLH
jgi:hypothetical protein